MQSPSFVEGELEETIENFELQPEDTELVTEEGMKFQLIRSPKKKLFFNLRISHGNI